MATITGIEPVRGRVDLYLDGALFLRLKKAHFEKCPLCEGDEIDPDEYLGRLSQVQFSDAWESALTGLEKSARTEKEVADSLLRRGYVAPVVAAVTERLKETRLLDDAQYAGRLAELQSKKPVGLYAFKRRLKAKGISDDDAAQALEVFDDQQQAACLEAAERLFKKYEALPPREGKPKLSQALARRGFGWDAIESALDQLFSD